MQCGVAASFFLIHIHNKRFDQILFPIPIKIIWVTVNNMLFGVQVSSILNLLFKLVLILSQQYFSVVHNGQAAMAISVVC